MEIVTSRVSVYEIELNLKDWKYSNTNQIPSFVSNIVRAMKVIPGKSEAFLDEVRKGADFAHVIEHVILELIRHVDSQKRTYTGWTRKSGCSSYVVHYSAPDFLTARVAAFLGVDIVKKLVQGSKVDLNYYIELLRNPLNYFSQEEYITDKFEIAEPVSVIEDFDRAFDEDIVDSHQNNLINIQEKNISSVFTRMIGYIDTVIDKWRNSFIEYCGEFGRSIINKIELLNVDKFMGLIIDGEYEPFFRSIEKISHLINTYRIPEHFVVHSIWLYKNKLLSFLMEEFKNDRDSLNRAIMDFEAFYQMILKHVSEGFSKPDQLVGVQDLQELREFRELKERKGLILVVDDDKIICRTARDILEYKGYKVLSAHSGRQALDVILEKKAEIAMVMLDLVLPDINGRKVFSTIKSLIPEMKILVTSGYPFDEKSKSFFNQEPVSFINKPFRAAHLIKQVQEMLAIKAHEDITQDTEAVETV